MNSLFKKLALAGSIATLFLLSFVVPKKKGLCVFGSTFGASFSGNTKYLFLAMSDGVWLTRSPEVAARVAALGRRAERFAPWLLLRAEYIFINATANDVWEPAFLFGRFQIVQLWHGTPIKKIALDLPRWENPDFRNRLIRHSFRRFHLINANDSVTQGHFKRVFDNPNVSVLGSPRNDVLLDASLCSEGIPEKLGLARYDKVIVYCPTFRQDQKGDPFSPSFMDSLEQYCESSNTVFLINKHWLDQRSIPTAGRTWIRDVSQEVDDLQELLVVTDLLISDYSSVVFDFVLTGRPYVLYCYDYDRYPQEDRGFYYDYFEDMVGPFARTEDELLQVLASADSWFADPEYQRRYRELTERFNHYRDAGSSRRVLEHLRLR